MTPKSTRHQNLTGNRTHAPRDEDYNEKLATVLAQRIFQAGHWNFVDVESLKHSHPGVWHMACQKTRALRAAEKLDRQTTGAGIQNKLKASCKRRERERLQSLMARGKGIS